MLPRPSITLSDFYRFRGRLGRLDFFVGILLAVAVIAALHFLLSPLILNTGSVHNYLVFRLILRLIEFGLATPLLVKRFHDLNSSGYWVLIFWVPFPFTIETAYLVDLMLGIKLDLFNEFIIFMHILGLLALILLLVKQGNPDANDWGSPRLRATST